MSNEHRAPACLGYIGDELLPSYVGIISWDKPWNKDPHLEHLRGAKWMVGGAR